MDNIKRSPKPLMGKIGNSKKKGGKSSSSLKVVYISSPMKVKTSASRFRALVQELTGRDSDIATLMMGGGDDEFTDRGAIPPFHQEAEKSATATPTTSSNCNSSLVMENSNCSPANSSECLSAEQFDDVFFSSSSHESMIMGDEQFMFPLDFVYDSSEIDVLGSYDAL